MDISEFRKRGKEMVDYAADYLEGIRDRRPQPDVQPGYIKNLIPSEAPEEADSWDSVISDIEKVIMPGVTHWQSPHFHAYYPSAMSYPSVCADILADTVISLGLSYASSPASTELEVVMMDWLCKMTSLPKHFLSGGKGGGVICNTSSETILVALLAARSRAIDRMKQNSNLSTGEIINKLVCYGSDQAHSAIERACLLGLVKYHPVKSDEQDCMRGETLFDMIQKDKEDGLVPICCVATFGTTPSCSFDNLTEVGPICQKEDIWLHIDAAYAGSALICPEYRHLMAGVEFADSFNFTPAKWLLVNFDCAAVWYKDAHYVANSNKVDQLILSHDFLGTVPEYRNWQIGGGRRFRSLKLWFVMRLFGVKGLQEHIRKHVKLAHEFEEMVKADSDFQLTHKVHLGLVCFRLKGTNSLTQTLLKQIQKDGSIHLVPSESKGTYYLRFCLSSELTNSEDIKFAWKVIRKLATEVLERVQQDGSCKKEKQ